MSKSLGNFVTIRQLLESNRFGERVWEGAELRLAMLRTHYRQPIDWTVRGLDESERTLDRWNRTIAGVPVVEAEAHSAVVAQLYDDLNTPAAISELYSLFTSGEVTENPDDLGPEVDGTEIGQDARETTQASIAIASARLVGLMTTDPARWAHSKRPAAIGEDQVKTIISDRLAARAAKNWAESDRIRDELKAMGVQLKDNKDGTTTWEVTRS